MQRRGRYMRPGPRRCCRRSRNTRSQHSRHRQQEAGSISVHREHPTQRNEEIWTRQFPRFRRLRFVCVPENRIPSELLGGGGHLRLSPLSCGDLALRPGIRLMTSVHVFCLSPSVRPSTHLCYTVLYKCFHTMSKAFPFLKQVIYRMVECFRDPPRRTLTRFELQDLRRLCRWN